MRTHIALVCTAIALTTGSVHSADNREPAPSAFMMGTHHLGRSAQEINRTQSLLREASLSGFRDEMGWRGCTGTSQYATIGASDARNEVVALRYEPGDWGGTP